MGEKAKVILNEYTAKSLLMRDTLDLDKFYTADLKLFIKAAREEIKRLNNELERYKQLTHICDKTAMSLRSDSDERIYN